MFNSCSFDRDYAAEAIAESVAAPENRLIGLSEIRKNLVGAQWLIHPFLEADTIGILFGESGSLKSFLAIDLALSVAFGKDFHGHKISKPGTVVYIAGEGANGLGKRIEAWIRHHDLTEINAPFYRSALPIQLMESGDVEGMADLVKSSGVTPVLYVIDTFSACMGAGNENSNDDVALALSNLGRYLRHQSGACVLIVHHTGHGDKDRERGAYTFRANSDFRTRVDRDGDIITWSCLKSKDNLEFSPISFRSEYVPIPGLLDNFGNQEGSLVLEQCDSIQKSTNKKRRLSARDDAILTSLSEAIAAHGKTPNTDIQAKFSPPNGQKWGDQKVVHIERWREMAYKAIVVDADTDDAKRMAFKRCRDKLLNQGLTVEYDNYAWRIFE